MVWVQAVAEFLLQCDAQNDSMRIWPQADFQSVTHVQFVLIETLNSGVQHCLVWTVRVSQERF